MCSAVCACNRDRDAVVFTGRTISFHHAPNSPPPLLMKLLTFLLLLCAQCATAKVFIVVEENHAYEQIIGNSAMPFLNSFAAAYSLETDYYGMTHPSIGNYFTLTTGQTITNDDSYTGTVTLDNIVRHLIAAGKTWKEYSESIPYIG